MWLDLLAEETLGSVSFRFSSFWVVREMLLFSGRKVKAQQLIAERALVVCMLAWCVRGQVSASALRPPLILYSTSVFSCAWSPHSRNPLTYSQRINLQSLAGMGRSSHPATQGGGWDLKSPRGGKIALNVFSIFL